MCKFRYMRIPFTNTLSAPIYRSQTVLNVVVPEIEMVRRTYDERASNSETKILRIRISNEDRIQEIS